MDPSAPNNNNPIDPQPPSPNGQAPAGEPVFPPPVPDPVSAPSPAAPSPDPTLPPLSNDPPAPNPWQTPAETDDGLPPPVPYPGATPPPPSGPGLADSGQSQILPGQYVVAGSDEPGAPAGLTPNPQPSFSPPPPPPTTPTEQSPAVPPPSAAPPPPLASPEPEPIMDQKFTPPILNPIHHPEAGMEPPPSAPPAGPDPTPYVTPTPSPSVQPKTSILDRLRLFIILGGALVLIGIIGALAWFFVLGSKLPLPTQSKNTSTADQSSQIPEPPAPPKRTSGGFADLPPTSTSSALTAGGTIATSAAAPLRP